MHAYTSARAGAAYMLRVHDDLGVLSHIGGGAAAGAVEREVEGVDLVAHPAAAVVDLAPLLGAAVVAELGHRRREALRARQRREVPRALRQAVDVDERRVLVLVFAEPRAARRRRLRRRLAHHLPNRLLERLGVVRRLHVHQDHAGVRVRLPDEVGVVVPHEAVVVPARRMLARINKSLIQMMKLLLRRSIFESVTVLYHGTYRHACDDVNIPYSGVRLVAAGGGELLGGVSEAGRAVAGGDVAAALREAVDDVVALSGGGRAEASGGALGNEVGEDGVDAGHGLAAARVAGSGAVTANGVHGHAQREQRQGDKQQATASSAKCHGVS